MLTKMQKWSKPPIDFFYGLSIKHVLEIKYTLHTEIDLKQKKKDHSIKLI